MRVNRGAFSCFFPPLCFSSQDCILLFSLLSIFLPLFLPTGKKEKGKMSVRRRCGAAEHTLQQQLAPPALHIQDFEAQMRALAAGLNSSGLIVEECVARASRDVLGHASRSVSSHGISRSRSPAASVQQSGSSPQPSWSMMWSASCPRPSSARPPLVAQTQPREAAARCSWSPQATPRRDDGRLVISGEEFLECFAQVFPLGQRPARLPFD